MDGSYAASWMRLPIRPCCWVNAWHMSCLNVAGGRCSAHKEKATMQVLANRTIVVTRAADQAGPLIARLRELGATPLACPAIAIMPPAEYRPLDEALHQLASYTWLIVTSVNGVRALTDRMQTQGIPVT